jgi:hypothetical protein
VRGNPPQDTAVLVFASSVCVFQSSVDPLSHFPIFIIFCVVISVYVSHLLYIVCVFCRPVWQISIRNLFFVSSVLYTEFVLYVSSVLYTEFVRLSSVLHTEFVIYLSSVLYTEFVLCLSSVLYREFVLCLSSVLHTEFILCLSSVLYTEFVLCFSSVLYAEFFLRVSQFSVFHLLVLYVSKPNFIALLRMNYLSVLFVSLYQLVLCICRLCGYSQFFLNIINSLCFYFPVLCDLPVSD